MRLMVLDQAKTSFLAPVTVAQTGIYRVPRRADRVMRRISAMPKLLVARAARQTARAKRQPWLASINPSVNA
jgi:hypothetical protein